MEERKSFVGVYNLTDLVFSTTYILFFSQLKVDMTEVQFGTSVIGETLRRHVTLTNQGALGTRLMFGKYTGKDHHIVTMKSPAFTQRVGSSYQSCLHYWLM